MKEVFNFIWRNSKIFMGALILVGFVLMSTAQFFGTEVGWSVETSYFTWHFWLGVVLFVIPPSTFMFYQMFHWLKGL